MRPINIRLHLLTEKEILRQEEVTAESPDAAAPASVFMPRPLHEGQMAYLGVKSRQCRVGTYFVPQLSWSGMAALLADNPASLPIEYAVENSGAWSKSYQQSDHVRIPLFPVEVPMNARHLQLLATGSQIAFQLLSYCPAEKGVSDIEIFAGEKKTESGSVVYLGFSFREVGSG